MNLRKIIISIILLIFGVSVEGIFGQVILENSVGNPFYWGIWLGVKLIIILGFVGLIYEILKKGEIRLRRK